ncbi:MAG: VCBS repeat-containing protein [Deltaproteobacteria bacterium]|nr:VCBS repeat-containing protein [Deltaproteobacteria bacterium]
MIFKDIWPTRLRSHTLFAQVALPVILICLMLTATVGSCLETKKAKPNAALLDTGLVYAAGHRPNFIFKADLNGAGLIGVIVLAQYGNTVSIFLGQPDGTLKKIQDMKIGRSPRVITGADFSGSGFIDLAIGDEATGDIYILKGDGQGGFNQTAAIKCSPPKGLAVADVSGSHNKDILVTKAGGGLQVLVGDGRGGFKPGPEFSDKPGTSGVVALDINGDGLTWVVTTNPFQGHLSLYAGQKGGGLKILGNKPVAKGCNMISAGDLNGDGRPDLALVNMYSGELSVLKNLGGGKFEPIPGVPEVKSVHSVDIVDVDRDGHLDLVMTQENDQVTILFGDGRGKFPRQTFVQVSRSPVYATVADTNGDGIMDLLTANHGSDSINLFPGLAPGRFQAPTRLPTKFKPQSAAVIDLDGKGTPSLVTADYTQSGLSYYRGRDDGSFEYLASLPAESGTTDIGVVNIKGDKRASLMVVNKLAGTMTVHLARPDGLPQLAKSYPAGINPVAIATGDLTGDGQIDAVVVNRAAVVHLFWGKDDGTFEPQELEFKGSAMTAVVTAKLAGHQGSLAILADEKQARLAVVSFDSNRRIATTTWLNPGSIPTALAVGDLNNTGHLDIVCCHQSGSRLTVFLADGRGGFKKPVNYYLGFAPGEVLITDVTGQGHADLVVSGSGSVVAVLTNRGDGTFNPPEFLAVSCDLKMLKFIKPPVPGPAGGVPGRIIVGSSEGSFLSLIGLKAPTKVPAESNPNKGGSKVK